MPPVSSPRWTRAVDDTQRLDALARAAADEVRPGMKLGLGSGSTAEAVVRELGRRVANGLSITAVPTSYRTERLARDVGITLVSMDEVERLDLGIDGADEVDPALNAIKGRGGALLHEKLVAMACADYVIVAAAEKLVPRLGTRLPLPVEVVPFGWRQTAARLEALGCHPTLRSTPTGGAAPVRTPFVSDGGHFVLDCLTDPITDPPGLASAIKATTGVVEHWLFLDFAHRVLVAERDGTVRRLYRSATTIPPL